MPPMKGSLSTLMVLSLLVLALAVALACATEESSPTPTPIPTNNIPETLEPSPIPMEPTHTPTPEPTSTPTPTPAPTATPTPTPTPTPEPKLSLGPGMYQVGTDIAPGIYAGLVGTDVLDSCYWARLSGASGDFSEIIANDNAMGQFYVEIQPADKYFEVRCKVTSLADWTFPSAPLSEIGPGMYLVGRDIAPGIYSGKAGTDVLDSCYWARLSGVSGNLNDIIANDNAVGQYYINVRASDYALQTGCELRLTDG